MARQIIQIDGPVRARGEVVRYQTLAGDVRRAVVLCRTAESGANRYAVLPQRDDGSYNPHDNPVYIHGADLWSVND